jgi:hypothetical protein
MGDCASWNESANERCRAQTRSCSCQWRVRLPRFTPYFALQNLEDSGQAQIPGVAGGPELRMAKTKGRTALDYRATERWPQC